MLVSKHVVTTQHPPTPRSYLTNKNCELDPSSSLSDVLAKLRNICLMEGLHKLLTYFAITDECPRCSSSSCQCDTKRVLSGRVLYIRFSSKELIVVNMITNTIKGYKTQYVKHLMQLSIVND